MKCKKCNGQGYIYVDIDWDRPKINMGQYKKCNRCKGFGVTGAEKIQAVLKEIKITIEQGNLNQKSIKSLLECANEGLKEYETIENNKELL